MRLTISFAIALTPLNPLLAVDPNPKSLAVPADQTERAKELARQLRSDDVDTRDKATTELAKMGRLALPVLLDTLKATTSNEVEIRIETILPTARKDDFTARCEAFLADKDRKFEHFFPGWDELKKLAGDTATSRKLFATILGNEERRKILLAAFNTDADGRKVFEGHWKRKWQGRFDDLPAAKQKGKLDTPYTVIHEPIEYLAGGLLAELVYDRDYTETSRITMITSELLNIKDKDDLLAGKGVYGDAIRKLAVRWVETRTHPRTVREATSVCVQLKLGEELRRKCLEKSCEIALSGGPLMTGTLGELAKTGDKKYLTTVRQFFENKMDLTAGFTGEGHPEVQQRDVALAYAVLLSGQKHKDYGFDLQQEAEGLRYYDFNYRFVSDKQKTADEKREAAFKKWAEWEKANPDALKASPPKDKK